MLPFWQSLVTKCSILILLAIVFSSLYVAGVSYSWIRNNEIDAQRSNLEDLLETMHNTTRAACFANNPILAQEVADGLRRNKLVSGSVIWSEDRVLAQSGQEILRTASGQSANTIIKPVYSPFDAKEMIGQIAISLDQQVIGQEAQEKIRFVGILLALQAALLAVVVIVVVLRWMVRPLKHICAELHDLRPFEGDRVAIPASHEQDELGLLVNDINKLNRRLKDSYAEERGLRMCLEQDEKRFRSIFEHAQTGLFVTDNKGRIQSSNPRFTRYLGMDGEQDNLFETPLGKNPDQLRNLLEHSESCIEYFELPDNAGPSCWLELNLQRINEKTLQGILNDVTELKRQEQQQRDIALTDALTGIANRRGFDKYSSVFLKNHRIDQKPFALMLIDLDWFKEVNDTYGHAAGDLVLCRAAKILQSSVRTSDYVSRLGGDEFAVILAECGRTEFAIRIAEDIIAHISEPIKLSDGNQVCIGASIGITLCGLGSETLGTLSAQADKALYQAKAAGRNCLQVYGA